MPEFVLGNSTITLTPSDVVGKGGEADIYRKGGEAYKIFKSPNHPDLAGSPSLQHEAKVRIAEHQLKLPAFPQNLPARVASPRELLRDKKGIIVGYHMPYLDGVEVLLRYGDRGFRASGIADDTVRSIFIDLYKTVEAVHKAKVVIGDFNDLNVLIQGEEAHIIDADSMQFGQFPARMFTTKFVDPLICDPNGSSPMMVKPHSPQTDWYAYLIMLMQSLLFVGPYGGVYRPKDTQKQIPHERRPLQGVTVFDTEVIYPKPARPYKILPDQLLAYFDQVFVKKMRGIPPLGLVENLRFTTCTKCGTVHARTACPQCFGVAPVMVKERVIGEVHGTKVFQTDGPILFATMQGGKLRYLYHHNGAYKREGDKVVFQGSLDPNIRFRICGEQTLFARGTECYVMGEGTRESIFVDSLLQLPLIDANGSNIFFAQSGGLFRIGALGVQYPERIGDVLQNQTLFWAGEEIGFGFYRAAELSNFFVFRSKYKGLNDSVCLPAIKGQLVDSTALFGSDRIWFFTTTQEAMRSVNRCFLLDGSGTLLASSEAEPGDGTWLGKIRGACAVGNFLLVPTDDGVVRVAQNGSMLGVSKEYPDTQRFVDSSSHLLIGNDGLFVAGSHEIWRLRIGN